MFGDGTVAFHGDYNELDAFWNVTNNIVHIAWADNRVPAPECDLSDDPGPVRTHARRRPSGRDGIGR
jgi:hypothetical protein